MKSLSERLVEFAVGVMAAALLLNWAWQLIRPLIPVIVLITGVGAVASFTIHRYRSW